MRAFSNLKASIANYKTLDSKDKKTFWKEGFINNLMYILIIIAAIYTYTQNHKFLSVSSIVNIISLSAANIPIALGIAGCIVLTGTDLSAGRVVGLTACISASLLQSMDYATKMFPNLQPLPIPVVILIVVVVGGIVGFVNGWFVAQFKLHPFIVTLATQLITYGVLLLYIMINGNNGQPLSGLDNSFKNFVTGSLVKFFGVPIPNYVWYAIIMIAFMWFMWNKTTFGKNMLCICDEHKPVCVAGVMGGANSEIVGDTAMVLFESANFNGVSVRRTASALGMRTDASSRYEKGLDMMNTIKAVERACELVELLGCGEVVDGVMDVVAKEKAPTVVKLEPDKINALLGTELSEDLMREILVSLGFILNGDDIYVPSWRGDVEHYSDIAEEVARFYGYNKCRTSDVRLKR